MVWNSGTISVIIGKVETATQRRQDQVAERHLQPGDGIGRQAGHGKIASRVDKARHQRSC